MQENEKLKKIKSLSVIIPVHNEENEIKKTISKIIKVINSINIEFNIWIIDDGSTDNSWNEITELTDTHRGIINSIKLSRNFGKDAAIFSGLKSSESDFYIVIDADGEHPIEKIYDFYNCIKKNQCDVVHGIKKSRRGKLKNKAYSRIFNSIFNKLTNIDLKESSDYKIFNNNFKKALLSYGDYDFFFRGVAQDIGFKKEIIYFDEVQRASGKTSWGNFKLLKYALNSIINYSNYPLYLILFMGLTAILLGLILGIKVIFDILDNNTTPEGYLSLLILSLLSMGMIMSSIGVLGVYLSKIFNEVKSRPRYIISESLITSEKLRK